MEKSLFNPHQKPRPFIIEAVRRNAVNRILVMLFALLLIPQGLLALEYVKYDASNGKFEKVSIDAKDYVNLTGNTNPQLVDGATYVASTDQIFSRLYVRGTVNIILFDQQMASIILALRKAMSISMEVISLPLPIIYLPMVLVRLCMAKVDLERLYTEVRLTLEEALMVDLAMLLSTI